MVSSTDLEDRVPSSQESSTTPSGLTGVPRRQERLDTACPLLRHLPGPAARLAIVGARSLGRDPILLRSFGDGPSLHEPREA